MLLGSPPDMVRGILSHRTRPFAHLKAQFLSLTTPLKDYNIKLPKKQGEKVIIFLI